MNNRVTRVMLVDDSEADRYMVLRAWEMAGIAAELHFATDGVEAIGKLNSAHDRGVGQIDMILMDINMPVQDGLQTVECIRRSKASYQHIPIVLWSSSRRVEDVSKAYESGANAYVVKPQAVADIVKLVESIDLFWCSKVLYPVSDFST